MARRRKKPGKRRSAPARPASGKGAAPPRTGRTPRMEEALAHYRAGRPGEAGEVCERLLRAEPDNAGAHHFLGVLAFEGGDLEAAIAHASRAAALSPGAALYHANLGGMLFEAGRHAEAAASCREAVRLDPESAEARNNLGAALKEMGAFEEAAACCRGALRLKPDYLDARLNLGTVLQAMGETAAAQAHFEEVLRVSPENAMARYNLGVTQKEGGDLAAAFDSFLAALRLRPDYPDARRALVHLLGEIRLGGHVPALEEEIRRGFSSPGIDAQALASVAAAQLLLKHGLAERGEEIRAGAPSLLDALARDPLFLAFLENTVNEEPRMEAVLLALRRALLGRLQAPEGVPPPELLRLASALALQCWNNEYVFYAEPEEQAAAAALAAEVCGGAGRGEVPPERLGAALLGAAMYGPPAALPCAGRLAEAAPEGWPEAVRPVVERTLAEPREEAGLREGIGRVGAIADATSRRVRAQYEENPYPRWLSLDIGPRVPAAAALRRQFPHFSPPARLGGRVRVLVAGCGTGKHPLSVALGYRDVEVVAVDLSLASLAYARRMAAALGAGNVTFLQGDILSLENLGERFPLIECAGVLHHMERPEAGWRTLAGLLEPGGVMKIGLYSEKARRHIVRARGRIRAEGRGATAEDIRAFRREVLRDGPEGELGELLESKDFYSASDCRDLLFHVQEHRFTLPAIGRMLDELGLAFIGFELPSSRVRRDYLARFPDDPRMTSLENWDAFEDAFPETFRGMYQFWCQKAGG